MCGIGHVWGRLIAEWDACTPPSPLARNVLVPQPCPRPCPALACWPPAAPEEEAPASPAPSDDGLVMDQGSGTPMSADNGGRMIGAAANDAMKRAAAPSSAAGPSGGGAGQGGPAGAAAGPRGGTARPAASRGGAADDAGPGPGASGASLGPSSSSSQAAVPSSPTVRGSPGAGDHGGGGGLMSVAIAPDDDVLESGAVYGAADVGSMDQLIWHPSDTSVKPIVANRRIGTCVLVLACLLA